MKLTTKQLRQIIKDELNEMMGNYKKAQQASSAPYRGPNQKYYQEVADILGGKLSPSHLGIPSRHNGPFFKKEAGVNGIIEFSFEAPYWPSGRLMIAGQTDNKGNIDHDPYDYEADEYVKFNEYALKFPVTGYPHIDAKFIEGLAMLNLSEFRRFARESKGATIDPELADMIEPGYPWKFLQ